MTEAAIKVFFSYSHRDEMFKDELVNHLSILQRQGIISGWHDRMISPGHEWNREIDEQLSTADIILLMVSADFLASDYCWGVEVKKALERHEAGEACVIPVVLRRVVWQGAPFAKLQALPKNAEPIASWSNRDDAFYNVATGISDAARNLCKARQRREEEKQKAAERARLEIEARQRREEAQQKAELQRQAAENAKLEAAERQRQKEAERQADLERRNQQREEAQRKKLEQQAAERARREANQLNFGRRKYLVLGGIVGSIILAMSFVYKPQSTSQPAQNPPVSSASITAADFYNRALEKQNKGDNQGAIADYTKAIETNNNWDDFNSNYFGLASAYYNRGLARYNSGDKQSAIADYDQAIKLKPDYADAYYNRGLARYNSGDKQSAIADYDQAIKLKPDDATAYYNRGLAHYDSGDNQSAIADYDQAIKLKPDYADAYNNRGLARYNSGDKQSAIADYDQAIKLKPDYADAYYNRGLARSALGNKQGAIADFQKAADLYQQQGKTKDYQDALNRIKKLQS